MTEREFETPNSAPPENRDGAPVGTYSLGAQGNRDAASRILFNQGASAICVYDANDRIVDWNERYVEFFPEVRAILRPGLPFVATLRPFLTLQHPHMSQRELDENVASGLRRHRTELGPIQYQRADSGRWLQLRAFIQPEGGRIKMWTDVTQAHSAGTDADQLLRLMAVANLGLIVHDSAGQLRFVNSRFFSDQFLRIITTMPAIQTRSALGPYWSNFGEIFQGDERYEALLREESVGPLREAITLRARTGYFYRIEEQHWEGGIASLWTDVTALLERKAELRRANEALEHLNLQLREAVETDALTGLPNRRRFDVALQKAVQASKQSACNLEHPLVCCVGILDLDHFKSVNDRLGHDAGDAVLIEAAGRLRDILPDGDLVARLGGEEFGLIFRDASIAVARTRAQALCQALSRTPFDFGGVALQVTASIGVALLDMRDAPSSSLRRADIAMFQAKSSGRNCVV